MELIYGETLKAYMEKKGKQCLVLEVATANTSDIEITECFLRFVSEKNVSYLVEKKKFRKIEAPIGIMLLPDYRLVYDEKVIIDMKKVLCFHKFTYEGIRL